MNDACRIALSVHLTSHILSSNGSLRLTIFRRLHSKPYETLPCSMELDKAMTKSTGIDADVIGTILHTFTAYLMWADVDSRGVTRRT